MPKRLIVLSPATYTLTQEDGTDTTSEVVAKVAGSIAQSSPTIGDTLTVTGDNTSALAGFRAAEVEYIWEESADGATGWSAISGATSASLDTSSGVTGGYYVRRGWRGPNDTAYARTAAVQSVPAGAWDISTASYSQNFSVAAQVPFPRGIFFRPDGTKMYVVDSNSDDVNEYSLSTAWDISTASYWQNFSVSAQVSTPYGLFFRPDGTKMYVVDYIFDDVNEYSLSTAWDISTASYWQNFSVSAQAATPTGFFFRPDGTKMYVVDTNSDDVNEYDLSTAWDISTASYSQNFSVAAQMTDAAGLFFRPDGTKMYVVDTNSDDVNEYDLSTAWDISTASYAQNFSVSAQVVNPVGLFFRPDGTKMYVVDPGTSGDVTEYDLGV